MKKSLFFVFIFATFLSFGQQMNLQWVNQFGASGEEDGKTIGTDILGNVYIAGCFRGTTDFDPGPGVHNLTSNGSRDFFVSKLSSGGSLVWVRQFGGDSYEGEQPNHLVIDKNFNIYVTGNFEGVLDFDPGPSAYTLSATNIDAFIFKLDSAGNFAWAVSYGTASGAESCSRLAVDNLGSLYAVGQFWGYNEFAPGPDVSSYYSNGDFDAYISKFDTDGNYIWTKTFGGQGLDMCCSVVCDTVGNVYCTGIFMYVVDFDFGPTTYSVDVQNKSSTYVCKFDSSCALTWVKYFYGSPLEMTINSNFSTLFVTGAFRGLTDFDSGPLSYTLNTALDCTEAYLAKFTIGGSLKWVKQFGGQNFSGGTTVKVDHNDDIYVAGYFTSSGDFDPSPSVLTLTSLGGYDIFFSKLDTLGNLLFGGQIGGADFNYLSGISIDNNNDILVAGASSGTCDYNVGSGIFTLTANPTDMFVAKYSSEIINGIAYSSKSNSFQICPNPTNSYFNIYFQSDERQNVHLKIRDVLGKCVRERSCNVFNVCHETFDLNNCPSGVYFVELTFDGKKEIRKIIKE